MTPQPQRDEAAVDEALRNLETQLKTYRAKREIERIRRHNEQAIPALLKRQAGGV